MKPLKINPEYKKLVPPISPEEYRALEADIIGAQGCFEPIKINKKDEILDGHNRFEICNKRALYFDTQIVDLPTVLDEKIYVVKTNLLRRQLNDYQKVEMAKPLENLIAEKARQRMSDGGKGASFEATLVTAKEVAKAIGVSKATYERAKKIRDEGTDKEKTKARERKHSINSAYRDIVVREKRSKLTERGVPPLPEGLYDVILADPPWVYDVPLRGAPDLHYPTMKTDEICSLKVPIADDTVLFLWATNPKLEDAFRVMKAWGFTYKSNLVWVKDKIGTGYWFRGQHELLLVGTRGKVSPPPEDLRRSSVLEAPRHEHSEKPSEIYGLIESYFPNGRFLELFSRDKRDRWISWGSGD